MISDIHDNPARKRKKRARKTPHPSVPCADIKVSQETHGLSLIQKIAAVQCRTDYVLNDNPDVNIHDAPAYSCKIQNGQVYPLAFKISGLRCNQPGKLVVGARLDANTLFAIAELSKVNFQDYNIIYYSFEQNSITFGLYIPVGFTTSPVSPQEIQVKKDEFYNCSATDIWIHTEKTVVIPNTIDYNLPNRERKANAEKIKHLQYENEKLNKNLENANGILSASLLDLGLLETSDSSSGETPPPLTLVADTTESPSSESGRSESASPPMLFQWRNLLNLSSGEAMPNAYTYTPMTSLVRSVTRGSQPELL